jgi:soluble lytic murein transglycosylase-like protein
VSFDPTTAALGIGTPLDPIISAAAMTYNVDAALIKSVITKESSWNVGALRAEPQIGDASYGLMQLLLKTAQGMRPGTTPSDLFDPAINIDLGTRYLAGQLGQYGYPAGVSAYNAGHPISGNAQYVADVDAGYQWFIANDPALAGAGAAPFPRAGAGEWRDRRQRLAQKPPGGH